MGRLTSVKCPTCGAGVHVDPAQEWATCSYCNTKSFIETRSRRDAPNHPPPSVPVIRVRGTGRFATCLVVMIAAPLVVGGVVAAIVMESAKRAAEAVEISTTRVTGPNLAFPVPQDPSRPEPGGQRAPEYFTDASPIAPAFASALQTQSVLAKELVIYATYAIAEIQNPAQPENIDAYTLMHGAVGSDSRPIRLSDRDKRRLAAALFDLGELELEIVPRLAAEARSRLPYPDGSVTHIIVDRTSHRRNALTWRVYVNSERGGGYVLFDDEGRVLRVVD